MWIKNIRGDTRKLAEAIRNNISAIGLELTIFEVYEDSIKLRVRLLKPEYHTLPYELSKNWHVVYESEKPIAVNIYFSDMKQKIRKHRYANTIDFARLNEMLNILCDSLKIEATIFSQFALGKLLIREKDKNVWLENFRELCYSANVYPEIAEYGLDSERVKNLLVFDSKQTRL